MQLRMKFLSGVLDHLEQKESRLLVWGVVDAMYTKSELVDIIDPIIVSALEEGYEEFFEPDEVISALLELGWLVKIDCTGGSVGFRSRMSETVRLLQRLRQLFPKHGRTPTGWQNAPTLVADFRFHRRRRQYPRRDVPYEVVLKRIRANTENQAILTAVRAILGPMDGKFLLSGFQVRATERILHSIESNEALATIVCAGTGSGKTMAFYLPALASIARHHLNGDLAPWVKTVALYPRSELLKDQLREVIRRTLTLKAALKGVTVTVGALYGDTPVNAKLCKWDKIGDDFVCPSLKCVKCSSDLRWLSTDHIAERERLSCHACGWEITSDVYRFTRKSLAKAPPDILFTTTEMLNQRLSDNGLNHLFGVGSQAKKPPELVLLDEVHTYEGRHGAQVAYLMRRWAHLVDQPLRFVGLSATLREAPAFFASLTGTWQTLVGEVSPRPDEIESEGSEYMLALRGDPVSRAALLSATIQTTMLMQRCLDPGSETPSDSVSQGAFGQRTFVFTDDLDVTNRLYFDLLSAEGLTSSGRPDVRNAPNGGLAVLRRTGASMSRYQGGQDWRMCEQLGHSLSTPLVIDRVSSQDKGVDPRAQVVVATAALEVGFDDPTVGAVVQHKAPKGMAGFLQRKGRAGRTRGMRPWTVVILSDYGRDRITYQGYDLLFDPELPARTLPLSNRYITRMEAVFAAIDYLGQKLQDAPRGSVWSELAGPGKEHRNARLIKELRFLLESENSARRFESYLLRALKISVEEVSALLWEYPRPLMTMVLPTALRRLVSQWCSQGKAGADIQVKNNPLPEFVPATLFADLNLAEVSIELPQGNRPHGRDDQSTMSFFAAMKEFAPGRVSRRFGVRYRTERYWISPSEDNIAGLSPAALEIDSFSTHMPQGTYGYRDAGGLVEIPVFRPVILRVSSPAANIKDTSQARLHWFSQFVPSGSPAWIEPPTGGLWASLIPRLGFFTHARHAPIEVRRFATGSSAEIGIGPGEKVRLDVDFRHAEEPAALGTSFSADGVVFQLRIPDALFSRGDKSSAKWRALRTVRFFDAAVRGIIFGSVPNPFLREWLAQLLLSAITFEGIRAGVDLPSAAKSVLSGSANIGLRQVLAILFQSQAMDTEVQGESSGQDRLRHDIDDLLGQPAILAEMSAAANLLGEAVSEEWEEWLRGVYHSTLGAALLTTIGSLCPSVSLDDLSLDLERGVEVQAHLAPCADDLVEIWITEKSPGGSGLIEEFMHRYSEDPRRYFSMVRATLEMGEFELIDHQLVKLLGLLVDDEADSEVRDLVGNMRKTTNHEELTTQNRQLRLALLREGFSPFHGFLVSMANRVLRPGTGAATDRYLASSIAQWRTEEERLGLEIDLRVICYWLSQTSDIDAIVQEAAIPAGDDRNAWRLNAIYGLLWGRGRFIRQAPLQAWNPFSETAPVERLLVIDTLLDEREKVSVEDDQWMEQTSMLLAQGRLVTLVCEAEKRYMLGSALHALITNPVESGYIRAYPRLQGFRQSNNTLEADIELPEALQ